MVAAASHRTLPLSLRRPPPRSSSPTKSAMAATLQAAVFLPALSNPVNSECFLLRITGFTFIENGISFWMNRGGLESLEDACGKKYDELLEVMKYLLWEYQIVEGCSNIRKRKKRTEEAPTYLFLLPLLYRFVDTFIHMHLEDI